jgi:hypothetical protein
VRVLIVDRVSRAVHAGALAGDPVDVAHAFVALIHGLAFAETARRLGTTKKSIDTRWTLSMTAMLDGLAASPH